MQDHPKDAEFLNTPIRFYTEMQIIFGSTLATSRFALGSSEPLEVNNIDSVTAKLEGMASLPHFLSLRARPPLS
jgi:hypothetical protein